MIESLSTLSYSNAEKLAWQFLLAARNLLEAPDARHAPFLTFDRQMQRVVASEVLSDNSCLWLDSNDQWCRSPQIPAIFHAMFDLYLPVLGGTDKSLRTVAHLGQSIDAQIAARSGDSFYVTGEENRKHLHCLRALSDAVIVGAGTAMADNPQLTTRAVAGKNPVRVVIDSQARIHQPLGIFDDGQAKTILIHQSSADLGERALAFGPQLKNEQGSSSHQVERWVVPNTDEQLNVQAIIDLLAERGLQRLFIEGGGITVSRFYRADVLDRLHIAVAPLLAGKGIGALQLPGIDVLADAHRPPFAMYQMGEDILWDFDVSVAKSDTGLAGDAEMATDARGTLPKPQPSVKRIF